MTATARAFLLVGFISSAFLALPQAVVAQNGQPLESIDVYLDCDRRSCDSTYIRREIPFVNYVRERTLADVHLLITNEQTGSGGRAYKLNFIGLGNFSVVGDTLIFSTSGTDTDDERRVGLTRKIKQGLVPFLTRTSVADRMNVVVSQITEEEENVNGIAVIDPWNSWVFGVRMNGNFEAEESSDNLRLEPRVNASRTTEEWKIIFSANMNYRERNFDVGDKTITSITESGSLWMYVVNSIAKHWSLGASSYTDTSTRNNRKLSSSLAPALEFSLFPYEESSQREITAVYELRFQTVDYKEETIFDKFNEKLLSQSLKLNLDYRQPWGTAHAEIEGSNYLTDFSESRFEYYRLELGAAMSVRLVRGLNVNFGFGYNVVKDQLYLVKEELSDEEILLGTKRLPTSYEYDIRMGFSYNFGSIYNNVVNSRLNVF